MKAKMGKTMIMSKTVLKWGVAQIPPAAGSNVAKPFQMA